ncbi:hypothetical protein PV325_010633 [Microctonus aethiopoides]|nr:hypothetical protein PV325_010633 [Microctonus aethiopoides]
MLRTILISIAVITASAVSITSAPQSDNAVEEIKRQPIVHKINFHRTVNMEASWSGSVTDDKLLPKLFVLDYTEYADTFEEFREKYPMFRLDAYCKATSESIFGEKEDPGTQHHSTNDFALEVNGYHEEFLHIRTHKWGAYGVEVIFKIGFLKKGTNLFLIPYMYGQISSDGAYNRNLEIGLHINTITFYTEII